jgi:hypothetical protein
VTGSSIVLVVGDEDELNALDMSRPMSRNGPIMLVERASRRPADKMPVQLEYRIPAAAERLRRRKLARLFRFRRARRGPTPAVRMSSPTGSGGSATEQARIFLVAVVDAVGIRNRESRGRFCGSPARAFSASDRSANWRRGTSIGLLNSSMITSLAPDVDPRPPRRAA